MYTVTTAKEFDHLVLTHCSRMFQLDCTPDIARHILELYNEGNRNIRPKNVERLARLMRGGHWKCKRGTMPLKFDKNGRLFGGQHRLEAVIVADMTVTFFVMLDLDVDLRDIEDDVSPHQNQDNDPNLKKDVTAICRALTGIKFGTDEERRFYAYYKDAIDAVRGMFSSQPGVKIAGVLAEFVKAYETVPIGKLKYIARVLCSGLPEGRKGDAVIPKVQSIIKTVADDRDPRTLVDLKQPIYALEGDVLKIICNNN